MSKQIVSNLPRGMKVSYYTIVIFTAVILTLSAAGAFLSVFFEGNLLSYLTFPHIVLCLGLLLPMLLTNLLLRKTKSNKRDKGVIIFFAYYQAFFDFLLFYNTKIDGYYFGSSQKFWDFIGSAWGMLAVALILFFFLSLLFKKLLSLPEKGSILTLLLSLNIILIIFLLLFTFVELLGIFALPVVLFFWVIMAFLVRDVSRLQKSGELLVKKNK